MWLFNMVTERRLSILAFFGHSAHSAASAIHKPPSDWKWPPGRPNHTWLRAIESDLRPMNIGPSYAWKKPASREHWRSLSRCLCHSNDCDVMTRMRPSTSCTHTRLTALYPGLPGWAGTRKVRPIWILLEQEIVSGSGTSWACASLHLASDR